VGIVPVPLGCSFHDNECWATHAAGVRSVSRWLGRSANPGRTAAKKSHIGSSTCGSSPRPTELPQTMGPAGGLPMCIEFFRSRATGRVEFSARLLLSSSSAKRMRTPDVLTPEEIMALLKRTARTSSNGGGTGRFHRFAPWRTDRPAMEDVYFENLVIHVRRSVVMMVQGAPKTEASAKDVPLDALPRRR
jgi:hypothetical protein